MYVSMYGVEENGHDTPPPPLRSSCLSSPKRLKELSTPSSRGRQSTHFRSVSQSGFFTPTFLPSFTPPG